ncbi:MAG TPA: hypothetical protein VGM64_08270, partial [Lacunisphaera sp.]
MRALYFFFCLGILSGCGAGLRGAETLDETIKHAVLKYDERARVANDELIKTRLRIDAEKAPLIKAMRAAEDRIIAVETETVRLETLQEQNSEKRRQLTKDAEILRKNESYLITVAHDSLTGFEEGLLPGEKQFLAGQIGALQETFSVPANLESTGRIGEVATLLLGQVQRSLGGYTQAGSSLVDGSNQIVSGIFAFDGPEVFFQPAGKLTAGTVYAREGSVRPVTYLMPAWKPAEAGDFFSGRPGTMFTDASGGKALRLKEAKGTVWQHIDKGGIVSYSILTVGLLALLLIAQKFHDLSRMGV